MKNSTIAMIQTINATVVTVWDFFVPPNTFAWIVLVLAWVVALGLWVWLAWTDSLDR